MGVFQLSGQDGKTYEIEADDMGMAEKAFAHAFGGGAAPAAANSATALAGVPTGNLTPFDASTGALATQEQYQGYNGVRVGAPGDRTADLGNELTRRADEMLIGPDSAANRGSAALLNFGKSFGLGLPQNIGAGAATALGNGRTFRQNFQLADDQLAALGRQQPGMSAVGTLGGIAGSLRLPMLTPFSSGTARAQLGNAAVTGGAMAGVGTAADAGLDQITDPDVAAKTAGMTIAGGVAGGALQGIANAVASRSAQKAAAAAPADPFPKGVSPAIAAEAEAAQFGIPLTKGQATGSYQQQARENLLARSTGDDAPAGLMRDFFTRQSEAVDAAKTEIGRGVAGTANVIERPYDAVVAVADFARNSQRIAETVAGAQDEAVAAARAGLFPADPVDTAANVAAGVRSRAAADKARFKASYETAAAEPGAFEPGTFAKVADSIDSRIASGVRPIPVDPVLTPAASRAVADLRTNPPAGSSLAEVDQARKRLVAFRGSTTQNPTDRAAMDQVIRHFDDHVEDAMTGHLFSGSDRALDLYRKARGEFSAYQKTFRPQGAGDDVGRAMQQIVDRNAQPQEVANLLYGTSVTGNTGRAMRLADRLQEVLPPDLWQETQRGYLGRIVGDAVDPRRVVDNIQAALSGEGRGLSYKLLTDGQVAGLRNIQSGLRTAATIREGVPAWVRDLGKTDFDPAAVVQNLLGRGTTTGNVASGQFARGIRDMAGPESETWASVRQAAWQHLTAKSEGATADFGPQALANRITDFLEGKGRSLATVLYSAEERATMKAFASVMKTITPARMAGGSASPNSDTAPMLIRAMESLQQHQGKINMLLAGVGFAKGGPAGAAAAYGMAKGAGEAAKALAARRAVKSAQEAVSGAPGTPAALPVDRPLTGYVNPADRLLLLAD